MKTFTSTDPASGNSENTWFTPKKIIDQLGEFDTDPCTVSYRPFNIGKEFNLSYDNGACGLIPKWDKCGRMFINPPYGKELAPFMEKFIIEKPRGVMLIFARMGNEYVQRAIKSGAYCFLLRKRISFVKKDLSKASTSGADSMLVFWNLSEMDHIKLDGVLIQGVI
jgi:hypothetical protein